MYSFTAADATALTKSEVSYTPKGKIIDAIKAAARNGRSEISVSNFRISDTVRDELKSVGFTVGVGGISWAVKETKKKTTAKK